MSEGKTGDVLLTVEEVADLLRYSTQTVRRHFRDGTLPAVKHGGEWRAWRSEIVAALKDGAA